MSNRLSVNFTLEEFTASDTAEHYGISNHPDQQVTNNLADLCTFVLQPLRDYLGVPVTVTSGYRSPDLNTKLRGSSTSQHLTGQAADIVVPTWSNKEVADYIRNNLPFDQLIYEYPDDDTGEIDWIHVSFAGADNRYEALIAERLYQRKTWKTRYYPYTDDYFKNFE